jgi:hypothetical protein
MLTSHQCQIDGTDGRKEVLDLRRGQCGCDAVPCGAVGHEDWRRQGEEMGSLVGGGEVNPRDLFTNPRLCWTIGGK